MTPGDALPAIEKHVTQERIEKYAAASGDFNPIHLDREFATKTQFGTTIAHGMMIAAFVSEMMTVAFKEHWAEGGRLKLRFRAPVRSGETVVTFGQVRATERLERGQLIICDVGVKTKGGEVVISGEATVTLPAS